MAFYSKDQKGESIDSQKATTLINAPNQDAFVGFIPRATLELLLEPDSSVGIRIYNAFNNRTTDRLDKLVAVGVTEEGDEIPETNDSKSGYVVCSLQVNNNNGINISNVGVRHVSRNDATQAAKGIVSPGRLAFASFFSADDIEDLLNMPGCNGIIIHAIKTELPGSQSLHNSHLAIAAKHTVDLNGLEHLEMLDKQIISLNPCPPNCADSVSRAVVDQTTEFSRYLVPWS